MSKIGRWIIHFPIFTTEGRNIVHFGYKSNFFQGNIKYFSIENISSRRELLILGREWSKKPFTLIIDLKE